MPEAAVPPPDLEAKLRVHGQRPAFALILIRLGMVLGLWIAAGVVHFSGLATLIGVAVVLTAVTALLVLVDVRKVRRGDDA